ncbi:Cdc20 [Paramicrosporidium saccamoebae]|uniref:Cdc20 n=1 Tax=Paramicrosporidium saccamoebae TaxID=1246581 RepID=A0A2H9TNZ4_9FUNG|nr:Cdc20 [Paramicrosporidium saccamoebae]
MDRDLLSMQLQASKLAPSRTIEDTLNRSQMAPPRSSEDTLSHYTSHLHRQSQLGARQSTLRHVPSSPDRVLDAPGMMDDFYLNLLDWSVRNVLAVALGPSVYLWNGSDGSVRELMSVSEGAHVTSLSWIHDGKSIAVGTSDGCAQLWDLERSKKLRTMVASPGVRVGSLGWHRHLLSTGSRNGAVLTHDVRVAKHLITTHATATGAEVCGLAWSPDGRQLAAGSNDNRIYVWNSMGEAVVQPSAILEGHRSAIKALSWCPWRGNVLASGGGSLDRTIRLWDTSVGDCIEQVDTNSPVSSLVWSKTSRELVSAHGLSKNHLAIWKVDSQCRDLHSVAAIDNAHDSRILHMCLSPDGRQVATAAADESIKFWSLFNPNSSKGPSPKLSHSDGKPSSFSPFSLRTKSFR